MQARSEKLKPSSSEFRSEASERPSLAAAYAGLGRVGRVATRSGSVLRASAQLPGGFRIKWPVGSRPSSRSVMFQPLCSMKSVSLRPPPEGRHAPAMHEKAAGGAGAAGAGPCDGDGCFQCSRPSHSSRPEL